MLAMTESLGDAAFLGACYNTCSSCTCTCIRETAAKARKKLDKEDENGRSANYILSHILTARIA